MLCYGSSSQVKVLCILAIFMKFSVNHAGNNVICLHQFPCQQNLKKILNFYSNKLIEVYVKGWLNDSHFNINVKQYNDGEYPFVSTIYMHV